MVTNADSPNTDWDAEIEQLLSALNDDDLTTRVNAIIALGEIDHPRAEDILIEQLDSDQPEIVRATITTLIKRKSTKALIPIIVTIWRIDVYFPLLVTQAIAEIDPAVGINHLITLTFDLTPTEAHIFVRCIDILQQLALQYNAVPIQPSLNFLLRGLRFPHERVRLNALKMLDKVMHPSTIPFMLDLVSDPDNAVQRQAVNTLKKFDAETTSAVDKLMDKPAIRERLTGTTIVNDLKTTDFYLEFLHDSDKWVRLWVMSCLAWTHNLEVVPDIIDILPEENIDIRVGAIWALKQIKDPRAIHPLRNLLYDTRAPLDDGQRVCDIVIEALEAIGTDEALEIVEIWKHKRRK